MKSHVNLLVSVLVGSVLVTGPGRSQESRPPGPNDPFAYSARQKVAGTIRNFGGGFAGLMKSWEVSFRNVQPDVRFDDHLETSDAAFPALVTGAADLGPDGGEPALTETLSFLEVHGHEPVQITVATGGYNAEGRSNGLVIYVHQDNPIERLTIKQLDGIFGAERTGGLTGFKWTLSVGRGAERNIRTWGQLGLSGEWADKPIQTYGHAPSGTARFFQLAVLGNSDKWNPNYREYVETGSKMIGDDDRVEQRGGLKYMLANELAHDRYGIAWTVIPQARGIPGLKSVALAATDAGPYVAPSRETFENRTYPLARSIYIYLNRPPGHALDPKLAEFLRFILSRDGQTIVKNSGGYLPLPERIVAEQLRKLE